MWSFLHFGSDAGLMFGLNTCLPTQPALFMTVRREIAQSPSETGARSREGGAYMKQYVDRPSGGPACLDAVLPRPGLSQRRIREWSRNVHE